MHHKEEKTVIDPNVQPADDSPRGQHPERRSARSRWAKASLAALAMAGLATGTLGVGSAAAEDTSYQQLTIHSYHNNKLVDVPDDSTQNGQDLALWDEDHSDSQKWEMIPAEGYQVDTFPTSNGRQRETLQTFKLRNVHSGLCMEMEGTTPFWGAAVQQNKCDPNEKDQPNQVWSAYRSDSGRTYLINGASHGKGYVVLSEENREILLTRLMSSWQPFVLEVRNEAGTNFTVGSAVDFSSRQQFNLGAVASPEEIRECIRYECWVVGGGPGNDYFPW
jgi:hypothetical protein